jgi:hypothetical protein
MLRRSSQVKPLRRGARDRDVPAPVEGFACGFGPWALCRADADWRDGPIHAFIPTPMGW